MEILKLPGIVQIKRYLLFQALLMEKVPGKMRKRRTLFVRHFIKILKVPGKVRTADAKNTFLAVTLRKYRTLSFRHISVIEHHSSKSRPLGEDALEAEMMIALNGPSIVHCSGIVKESMST